MFAAEELVVLLQVVFPEIVGKLLLVADVELLAELGDGLPHPLVLGMGQSQHLQQQLVVVLLKERQGVGLNAAVVLLVVSEV